METMKWRRRKRLNALMLIVVVGLLCTVPIPAKAGQEIAFKETFTDNRHHWWEGQTDEVRKEIRNGKYLFAHKRTRGRWFARREIEFNHHNDFQIETSIKKIAGTDNWGYGIIWGGSKASDSYYF
ncbi:hypothetical protein GF339_04920, partial [candidate division KSB3 bacterium]|nr:hypothetical protein [candidate division KSB3 bacterium]MBD3323903.1 hypothetical protein [candidate division KSB3 bacterium]